ncbi:MAG: DUF6259 domain-containing protein [Acidobacteriales bacterium]|nr:DUF6259 domain-containing protein [Terriglobales bacterium]
MKTRIVLALFLAMAVQAAVVDPSKGLTLENKFVRLEFEPGGMGLAAMIDRVGGFNHIGPVDGKHLLWEVSFGRGTQVRPMNNNYKPCNYARVDRMADGTQRAVMEWNDLRWWLEDRSVTVKVTVDLPPDSGIARWRIFVENLSDYWGTWSVSYPLVNGFPSAGNYDIARPVQSAGGNLLPAWKDKIEQRYPSGNWPMQFLALSAGKNSVYFGTRDPDARAKDFVVEPGNRITVVHIADDMGVAGSDWPDYHPIELGVYQGDWVEAAYHYREWALQQKWARAGKLSQRPEMSDLVKNLGAWIQDGWEWQGRQGTPEEMNAPLVEAQKMMGVPLGIHWYMWHVTPFDNNYPYFLPAKPKFRERVKQLTDQGVLVMPYINGLSSDMNIKDFDRYAPHAMMDEGGGLHMVKYSEYSGRLLSMCPSSVFWHDAISTVVDKLIREEGVNGVYIDQISSMGHEHCFNPKHGHPLGGGHWWADGFRELMTKVQAVAQREGRRAVITSEGTDEVFFDLLDANLCWAQASDWEIPLMQVVYSGYTLLLGSPVDFTKSEQLFNFAEGQAFLDGRQIGWMGLGLFQPEHRRKAEYFRECARYRVAAKKYVTYGRLLTPVRPVNQVPTFTDDNFGWWRKHRGKAPLAEGRLWQAEDGKLAVLLANYSDQEIPFTWRVDPARYGVKGGAYTLTSLAPEGTAALGAATGVIERTEKLAPRQLRVVEIAGR